MRLGQGPLGRPQLEHRFLRRTAWGYEAAEDCGLLRCLDHGWPTPLARWHYHEEYELHLVVDTRGHAFIGEHVGDFAPGHLVLVGPRVPHNWVSTDGPADGVALRDRVIQFAHQPITDAAARFDELREILPLLERARSGIEFFGLQHEALQAFERIRASRGLQRLALFWDFMSRLAGWTDLRELRAVPVARGAGADTDEDALARIEEVVEHVASHRTQPLALPALARRFGMSDSRLSRFFLRATGQTLSHFVNGLRIDLACQLLHETDHYAGRIAREVGYRSVAAFNRRFVAVTGVTPTAYRCRKVSALACAVPVPIPRCT